MHAVSRTAITSLGAFTSHRLAVLSQVSALVPAQYNDAGLAVLLRQPILTRPGTQRILFTVAVPELAATIRRLDEPSFHWEHIYDY